MGYKCLAYIGLSEHTREKQFIYSFDDFSRQFLFYIIRIWQLLYLFIVVFINSVQNIWEPGSGVHKLTCFGSVNSGRPTLYLAQSRDFHWKLTREYCVKQYGNWTSHSNQIPVQVNFSLLFKHCITFWFNITLLQIRIWVQKKDMSFDYR